MNDQDQRWVTARHEAGHAVAALHYGALEFTSIAPEGISLGTSRIRVQERIDAVVIYAGPLAELDRAEFRPGKRIEVSVVGSDFEGLEYLREVFGADLQDCFDEAVVFIGHEPIQQQIDRVAIALLQRTMLTVAELRTIAGFQAALRPRMGSKDGC